MFIRICILIVLLIACGQTFCRDNTIDSLKNLLCSAKSDTDKINLYLDIGYYYELSDLEKSLTYYDSAKFLSQKLLPGFNEGKLKDFLSAVNVKKYKRELLMLSRSYRYSGIVYYYQSNLPLSLNNYQKSLSISEKLNDNIEISKCLTNIGLIQQSMNNQPLALEYYTRALELNRKMNDVSGVLNSLNQIGAINIKLKNYQKALIYLEEALKLSIETENKIENSVCLGNMGTVYKNLERYPEALESYKQALIVDEEMNDSLNISVSLNHIGNIYKLTGNFRLAIEFSEKSLLVATNIGFKEAIKYASQNLIECYAKLSDYKKCYQYFNIYTTVKDSIYNEQSSKQLHEMETVYQTEKKQLQIEKLNKEKELQQSELMRQEEKSRQQRLVIFFIIALLILISVFAVFIVQRLRITRKQKKIIEIQKALVDEKNIMLNQQNEEIKAQRDEIQAQRDHIKEINHSLTDSITYAKRIQSALLPDIGSIPGISDKEIISEYFILYRPKDIVSGDFYWATKINEWLVFTVADCTGHGVPGAFMSMLGISYLNEIVRKKEVTKASEVLEHLRRSIIDALKQKGISEEQKDGMDIALCAFNSKTMTLQFAGANNPLYIVKNTNLRPLAVGLTESEANSQQPESNSQLIEVKGDKMPVGIHLIMKEYSHHEIQLNKGDCIYLMSDGYEDQFGGPRNTKFMQKKLKALLLEISHKPMNEQMEELERVYDEWKNGQEQLDDVTIIGFRV